MLTEPSQNSLVPFTSHLVVPYMRVSTKKQAVVSQMVKLQNRVYKPNLWQWPTDAEFIFQEKETAFRSDGMSKRKELKRLLALAHAGRIRGMVVTRINRFFRNTKTALTIYDEFHKLGFKLIEAENPEVDYFTVEHKAAFLRKAAEAEAWSLDHANRVRDGKSAVHHDGRANTTRPTYGASRMREGMPVWTLKALIPQEAIRFYSKAVSSLRETADHLSIYKHHAESIYDLWREGKSSDDIAAAVDKPLASVRVYVKYHIEKLKLESAHLAEPLIFSSETIHRWLTCPTYYGLIQHAPAPLGRQHALKSQRRRAPVKRAQFKGITKRSTWFLIQALLAQRHKGGRGVHPSARSWVLSDGIAACALCGSSMVAMSRKSEHFVHRGYTCTDYSLTRQCESRSRGMNEDTAQMQLGLIFRRIKFSDEWIQRALQNTEAQTSRRVTASENAKRFQAERNEIGRQMAQRIIGLTDAAMLMAKIDMREAESHMQSDTPKDSTRAAEILSVLQNIGASWDVADVAARRQLLGLVCERIYINAITKTITKIHFAAFAAMVIRDLDGFVEVEPDVFAVPPMEDVRPNHASILTTLRRIGTATVHELAEQTGMPVRPTYYALQKWAEFGVVERVGRQGKGHAIVWRTT